MERNNTLQRLATFAVIMLAIGLFAFIGYQGLNPECDTKMKDGSVITCKRLTYGDAFVNFRSCEGERKTIPVIDVKEITYD